MTLEEIDTLLRGMGLDPGPPRKAPAKSDWTVAELYAADLPEPKWVVPGLLPAGLASLAGRPKLGKSYLALQLAAAVAVGGMFLERRVAEGNVLFIALEDPPRRLRERVRALWLPDSAPLQFYTEWPPLNEKQGLYELEQTLAEWQPRLVVIDTLARAYDCVEWNAVREATAAMAPLQQLAHGQGCCILTVDHHRKPGLVANVVDDILGSTGKAAVIDTAWGLYKAGATGRANLRVTGRDIEACELALEFGEGGRLWQLRSQVRPVPRRGEPEEARVVRALRELGNVATTHEIALSSGLTDSNVSRTLRKMMATGRVLRRARQGRRVPYELADSSQPRQERGVVTASPANNTGPIGEHARTNT